MDVMTLKVTKMHAKFYTLPLHLIPAAIQYELCHVASVRDYEMNKRIIIKRQWLILHFLSMNFFCYVFRVRKMNSFVDSNGVWHLYIQFFSYTAALGVMHSCVLGLLPFETEWASSNLDYLYTAEPVLRSIEYLEPCRDNKLLVNVTRKCNMHNNETPLCVVTFIFL